jgi:NADPH-ferrihemoprotein reductase
VALTGVAALASGAYYLWKTRPRLTHDTRNQVPACPVKIKVLYGSQTGTSETFARDLAEEARTDKGFPDNIFATQTAESVETTGDWFELENHEDLNKPLILIVILSTYGEGDPSDDAVEFDRFLALTDARLEHIRFAIFGCGNKQYALYNEMAKRTERNLLRLGASRVCKTGFGDDNADIEADFAEWKQQSLWEGLKSVLTEFGIVIDPNQSSSTRNPLDRVNLDVSLAEKRSKLKFDACVSSSGGDVLSKFFFATNLVPVVGVRQLCQFKTHIDIDISKVPSLRYRSGDTLELLPKNRAEDVDMMLSAFRIDPDHLMTFVRKPGCKLLSVKKPFPTPVRARFAVEYYVDLHGVPSRALIRDLCIVCGIPDDGYRTEGKTVHTVADLIRTLVLPVRSRVDFGDLLQLLPKQKPRAYSICSSPLEDGMKLSIVVSRVDDEALASTFLSDSLKQGDFLPVCLRQGSFRLPPLPSTPVIMIAAGTGVAPYRAFIIELCLKGRCASATLFFGCRSTDEWIYRAEMENFERQGGTLHVAFSRERNNCYVQDSVELHSSSIRHMVDKRGASIFVCGSTKMGLAVMRVFDSNIAPVSDLRAQKRYFEELWG